MCILLQSIHRLLSSFFFFNDTATTEIYTLSLHDALPIFNTPITLEVMQVTFYKRQAFLILIIQLPVYVFAIITMSSRSEEHTSELQSLAYLVCRLLLEKKKKINISQVSYL